MSESTPVISVSPVTLSAPGRSVELQVRISAPVTGNHLPILVFAHGFGSSLNGYAPLAQYWAAHGFVVIQPTFLDSRSLSPVPSASHSEAVAAFLNDPRKFIMWQLRIDDMKQVLDQLDGIIDSVPGLAARVDRNRIAAAGHSFGAQTVAMLLGGRVMNADGTLSEEKTDARIKAGVLLSAGGSGREALSPFALEHFSYLDQSYAGMTAPVLVVAGDQDNSPLTVRGPEWFTDAYTLSPGNKSLLTLFGGEHMLGGISGYHVTETTDENPARVAVVQKMTCAYLHSVLDSTNNSWTTACKELNESPEPLGCVENKR